MCECCGTEIEKDIYLPEPATVIERKMLNATELYLHMELDSGKELGHQPGEFVEVSIAGIGEAPISVSSSPTQEGVELVIRNVGSVTNAIHNLKEGDKVGIRGPYGTGYPVEELKGKNLIFICGGIGLVPQRSMINYALDNRDDFGDITILQGTRASEDRFFVDELAEWGKRRDMHLMETVDAEHPEWQGSIGVVTVLMPRIEADLPASVVLICGPPIMYKFVMMALWEAQVPKQNIFLNLERRMKCGVGKCGHCQINDKYVCQEGPVLRYSDLANVPEAI